MTTVVGNLLATVVERSSLGLTLVLQHVAYELIEPLNLTLERLIIILHLLVTLSDELEHVFLLGGQAATSSARKHVLRVLPLLVPHPLELLDTAAGRVPARASRPVVVLTIGRALGTILLAAATGALIVIIIHVTLDPVVKRLRSHADFLTVFSGQAHLAHLVLEGLHRRLAPVAREVMHFLVATVPGVISWACIVGGSVPRLGLWLERFIQGGCLERLVQQASIRLSLRRNDKFQLQVKVAEFDIDQLTKLVREHELFVECLTRALRKTKRFCFLFGDRQVALEFRKQRLVAEANRVAFAILHFYFKEHFEDDGDQVAGTIVFHEQVLVCLEDAPLIWSVQHLIVSR